MLCLNILTPVSDQDRISPHNINTILRRKEMRIKKHQSGDSKFIQYQILRTNLIRIVWQIIRRITNEILGVKGLTTFNY